MDVKNETLIIVLVAVAVVGAAWYVKKKVTDVVDGVLKDPEGAGAGVADTVTKLTGGVVSGTANGVGDWFGLPRTEKTACEKAKESGSAWDASFACPAGEFIGYVWNR